MMQLMQYHGKYIGHYRSRGVYIEDMCRDYGWKDGTSNMQEVVGLIPGGNFSSKPL